VKDIRDFTGGAESGRVIAERISSTAQEMNIAQRMLIPRPEMTIVQKPLLYVVAFLFLWKKSFKIDMLLIP
jgi:hypothetical protein